MVSENPDFDENLLSKTIRLIAGFLVVFNKIRFAKTIPRR